MTVFYLHGFVSSPKSTKVQYFTRMLGERGIDVRCPDFNEPEFRTMTMTRMLEQLDAELSAAKAPAVLIGSSLGGTLAILAAARFGARVGKLVLLAPAVMFGDPDHHLLPREEIEQWKRQGDHEFFHYARGGPARLAYAFYEDSLKYDAFGTLFPQPTLIFQGKRDAIIDWRDVERFAASRPNVALTLVDDDHQLIASLARIWSDVEPFLGVK
jgi:pimeloyl-ACP methyl ester carboxylesterase